jgi:hypothetical protein
MFQTKVSTTATERAVLARALATVAKVHDLLAVRGSAPPHVHRGFCLDCDAAVELAADHACYCGSRSVLPARGRRAAA